MNESIDGHQYGKSDYIVEMAVNAKWNQTIADATKDHGPPESFNRLLDWLNCMDKVASSKKQEHKRINNSFIKIRLPIMLLVEPMASGR